MVCCRAGKSCAPPVNIGRRCSRRASSAPGSSTLRRVAASSIANGRPSSRPRSRRSRRIPEVRANWTVGRFRATHEKSTAGVRASSSNEDIEPRRQRQRANGYSRSTRMCRGTRLVASIGQGRTCASRSATKGRRGRQMLEVVEEQEQLPRASAAITASRGDSSGLPRGREPGQSARARAQGHDRGQIDEDRATGKPPTAESDLDRKPRFAHAAKGRTASGGERWVDQRPPSRGGRLTAADDRGRGVRQRERARQRS